MDLSDPVTLLIHLFSDGAIPCEKAADVNDSGNLDLSDAIYALAYLFSDDTAPPQPFGACGIDPTADGLTCENPRCASPQFSVIISEILASNAEAYADEDGDSSDWIELQALDNPDAETVDLTDWYLTDDANNLTKWRFPSVSLEPGDYLLVFASNKDRAVAGQELHTNFRLESGGEYLALVAADGMTIIDEIHPAFPEQITDVSYGLAQWTDTVVKAGDDVMYHVPTAGDAAADWTNPSYLPAGWDSGTLGLGFTGIATEGFQVRCIKANITVGSLTDAESVLNNPGQQSAVYNDNAPYIDYFNSGGSGNFGNDVPFPGLGGGDIDDFILHATGTVLIPETGPWSFGVNSDDGFSFSMTNGASTFDMSHPTPRGPGDTIQVFNITQAGPYEIDLLFYERGGGAEVELFAARGNHPSFNNNDFHLVGDTGGGGLGLLGFASQINTDIEDDMQGINASVWTRSTFVIDDVTQLGGLHLRMMYEDGFVAFLNGHEVARANAPATLSWNSNATMDRPVESATIAETYNLTGHISRLRDGLNVLAIQGLNNSASNGDFLLAPELIIAGNNSQYQYMETPTPDAFNLSGSVDFVRRIAFSVEHGFFDASFPVALSTVTDGAQIRYTLDGSTPTDAHGHVYSNPITIDETTTLRAAGFKSGHLGSQVFTQTYIFPADVIQQSPSGQRPATNWPSGSVNGQVLDYGMDPDIVNNAQWSGDMIEAMLAVPTMSIVTDIDNLFGASSGIYVNPRGDGRVWERPISFELIHPDGTEGFSVNAGLRLRGAFSRSTSNPKHSLRVFFRNEYGPGRLQYPLFGGEGADEFDKIDLRTSQNYSWAFSGDSKNTMLREVFSRDVQYDMGQPYTRSRYYHVYLNGHYWGLFQTQERADADFAETYLHGNANDYDVVKNDSSGSRVLQATDGNMDAYWRLYSAAVTGFSSTLRYMDVQGLNADGTVNPSGEQLVEVENLMDYMICTYYTGDPDAPISCWAHFSNNIFAIYNRARKDGFTWYRHDAEHSLGTSGGLYEDRLLTDPTDRTIGSQQQHFNPAWLHLRLTAHPEYLMQYSDRVCKYFFNEGILSPAYNIDRWNYRVNQMDMAIIAESARWGDAQRSTPRNKNDWLGQVNYMVDTYFPQRTQIVLDQMRSVDMFPDEAIVTLNQPGGHVAEGFQVVMAQGNGIPGTIYYTLNGSDPREWGGGLNPAARVYESDTSSVSLITRQSVWKYQDNGANLGTAWRGTGYNDNSWDDGPAELGYGDGGEATEVGYGGDENDKHVTTYFRRTFTASDVDDIFALTLGLMRDDGAVVYLNGTEIARPNMPGGTITYQTLADETVGGDDESTFVTYDVDPDLLVEGTNLMAVEIHQASVDSSDISFDLELTGLVSGGTATDLTLIGTTTVKARVRNGTTWGAMTEARFMVGLEGLVINEVMASNHTTLEDPDEPNEYPDWIELYNGTGRIIDLSGMSLTDDPQDLTKWSFAQGLRLDPGEHLVIYADDDGTQGIFHTNYTLSRNGETIVLVDNDGKTIIDAILFDLQRDDVSFGRYPDGGDTWDFHQTATPGAANGPHLP